MRKHKNKIFYSAGLICLVLLPILCLLNLRNHEAFNNCYSMDVQFWDGKEDSRNKGLTELLNSKTYTTFNLNGDNFADLKKIKIAENEIKRIVSSRDSVKGVKFHFGPKSEYAIFIKV